MIATISEDTYELSYGEYVRESGQTEFILGIDSADGETVSLELTPTQLHKLSLHLEALADLAMTNI